MQIRTSVFIYVCMSVGVCIYTYEYILTYPFLSFFFSFNLNSHICSELSEHSENKGFVPI